MQNLRYAVDSLIEIPGISLLNDAPFAYECALQLPKNAEEVADMLCAVGYVPGLPLGRYYKGMDNVLLLSCTEQHTKQQIDSLVTLLRGAV
jgi:glycine dehydrogenase subunit 1